MVEKVQRSFTRFISGMAGLSYTERLAVLKLYSLQRRRERYIVIYVWKILDGLVPIPVVVVHRAHCMGGGGGGRAQRTQSHYGHHNVSVITSLITSQYHCHIVTMSLSQCHKITVPSTKSVYLYV